jgi:hypothetical protein
MYLKLLKYIGICLICGFTSFVLTSFLKSNVPTVSALTKTDYRSNLSQLISVQSEVKFRTLDFSDLKFTKTKDTNEPIINQH